MRGVRYLSPLHTSPWQLLPLPQYARARRMLYQAKDSYSGYEFEARVNFKVHAALNDIDLAAELQKGTEQ